MFSAKTDSVKASPKNATLISQGCELEGELILDCHMQIDGQLLGQIRCSHSVTVSQPGRIKGKIYADHIIIKGRAEGEFYADRVEILQSGLVSGTIYSDNLSIEQGGRFIGEIHAADSQKELRLKDKPAAVGNSRDVKALNVATATGAAG